MGVMQLIHPPWQSHHRPSEKPQIPSLAPLSSLLSPKKQEQQIFYKHHQKQQYKYDVVDFLKILCRGNNPGTTNIPFWLSFYISLNYYLFGTHNKKGKTVLSKDISTSNSQSYVPFIISLILPLEYTN